MTQRSNSDSQRPLADGPVLHAADLKTVTERYETRIAEMGPTVDSLKSGGAAKQFTRHCVHTRSLSGSRPAVLDIGCGIGCFCKHLIEAQVESAYTGYDVVPAYIDECRRRYSEARFELRNVFEEGIDGVYDSIVMSQVLNNRYTQSDNMEVLRTAMNLAYDHSRHSVSIDMMSSYVDYEDPQLFYYVPEEVFRTARSITPKLRLLHDYLPYEFCIQLFH